MKVVIAIVAQSIGSLVLCAIYCLIHRKYREKWEHYPWTANFNAALFKLLMDLSNTMIILVLGLVVGAFVTRHRTTAYHLRMVAYLATLNTYAVILIQYFTWWTGSVRIRRQRQRVLYLIIIVSAWAVSLGFGIWKTKDRLEREENCLSNKTDVGIPVAWSVYIVLIQAGLLLFFAVVTDPLRRWRDSKYGDAARGTILRPKTSTKWKIGIVTFLLCGVPLTPSYGYYRFVVICQCIAFIIMDLYFIALWRGHYSELFGEEQNAWGMGQVLSLVLLLIPLTEFVFSLRPIGGFSYQSGNLLFFLTIYCERHGRAILFHVHPPGL